MSDSFFSGLERTVRKSGTVGSAIVIAAIVSGPACGDIRMVYEIDDEKKEIIIVAVGSHKVYG